MKIKLGDQIMVTIGKDAGKTGKVEKVFPRKSQVLITGLNLYKKHLKPSAKVVQGGIIDFAKPINVADVALICPKCNLQTRVGYRLNEGKKERICRKCKQQI
ncbi:MAG: 50S ribosomal protein L24 [Candidatus Woykebacteria bacterium RIFCSPHIGHO2_01_FULL_39_12]|uniref:Large ribosomal subunit protein uL24 n=2 Tax=Candidatus Woykeibacteriota TaxID=1817899 RepID=A0A1G1WDI3_9BACT|nr:MAG: 50S ribosomal protein L24 [Candidatus Woykebacteria bacterium RBG_16_39_9b]OGY27161.1 MAG: 50S ribosomal protein L24 [Candidatus Woykebacteria bacterium RIFCSPHIGHO2_01_FULL_39_12]